MAHYSKNRLVIGILLIMVGLLFFLENNNFLELPYYHVTWEYFFILFGSLMFALAKNKTVGVVFIAIGLFNLVPELWPLIFVLVGLYIIFRKKGAHASFQTYSQFQSMGAEPGTESSKDTLEDVAIFGGSTKVYHTDNFRGGSIVSIFGGSEINLANCKLADGDNTLDITAIFGGSTIIIPQNWEVEIDVMPIFGGFGDKRMKDPFRTTESGRKLIIKGVVLFGGGEIKN